MRPQRSIAIASRAVAAWLLLSGCSPGEPPAVVAVPPLPPSPPPEFRPPPRQIEQLAPAPDPRRAAQNQISVDRDVGFDPQPQPPAPRRLVFECSDGITFAVLMLDGNRLHLYPPKTPGGFLALTAVPSASGVHYRIADIDFFSTGDVATLEMGRERYVDCVANPAASTWEDPEPRTGPLR